MSENGNVRRTSTAQDHLLQALRQLSENEKYADLTVSCGTRTWKVHNAVVCPQSDFFAKACDGAFMEAKSNTVSLVDDDSEAVAAMMHYFYHCDYHTPDHGSSSTGPLVLEVRIYALADKYFIKALRSLAYSKFKSRLRREWSTPALAGALREVYLTGKAQQAKFLRNIERVLVQHLELVYQNEQHHDLYLVLRDNGHAALRVAMILANELDWARPPEGLKGSA
ncbi:hypothetical protein BDY17DRAFT_165012 [Neohortaea acidophila]|uniref:BTB domain-containing protein n=1 Tax=Neohortaea acidophila TaxID=245834 RepID=A0A6A6PS58_9PEZI|nr:uncharacterized protein BDY17DRAFT_165012 [Neohortaea acidophila]KAF2482715.1 hypothetical protein BDY17DRAFT_165012 [Neohortaea acidophila]